MNRAPRSGERQTALRGALLALAWVLCVFVWGATLTFSSADPPAASAWPVPARTHNVCGIVGAVVAYHAFAYLGWGVFPTLFVLTVGLAAASRGAPTNDLWLRLVGLLMIGAASACAGSLVLTPSDRDLVFGPGGMVGRAAAPVLLKHLEVLGTWLCLTVLVVVGMVLAADNVVAALFRGLRATSAYSAPVLARGATAVASAGSAVAGSVGHLATRIVLDRSAEDSHPRGGRLVRQRDDPADEDEDDVLVDERRRAALRAAASRPPARQAARRATPVPRVPDREDARSIDSLRAEPAADTATRFEPNGRPPREEAASSSDAGVAEPAAPAVRTMGPRAPRKPAGGAAPLPRLAADDNYKLPPLDLLDHAIPIDRASVESACREKAYVLEQTLNEFRLEVQVVAIETGPVITVFELKLAPGIKVSQIASLSNDMARALRAPSVRVVAPLPGKTTIGIEVPNIDKEKVRLRDVIEQFGSRAETLAIPLYLGKDASGQPLVADLTRMPHLLIAGTTGSGKSVCVGSIIMSILMTRSPSEVHMIMVDPKVVELSMYKDVPHLICPIVTEMPRAQGVLEWASTKMDERYALLAEAGVKDIRGYNRLGLAGLRERLRIDREEELAKIPLRLPYIVIIVDELADLMMTSPKEVEFHLCRIAQKSRAVGIHLIVATQRPQANVVTGLIKANLPSRIAFRVASRLDSRIVLDQNGGEVLMGQGDMLFLPPGSSKLVRAQGTFVDDDELRSVVRFCKEQRGQEFHPELVRLPGSGEGADGERDELFDEAVDIIVQSQRGSVSLLQRRFNIGYSRASRLVDQMYAAGIVGEYKGSQAREVLVTKEEWQALKAQRDREEAEEA